MGRSARLGVFIALALLLLGIGIFLIGKGRFIFGETYRLKSGFETVSGLADGAEVRIGGVRVGTVSSIALPQQPGGNVMVEMELAKDTLRLVRKDSTASIQTEGLLGNKFVRLNIGSAGAPQVHEGDSIPSKRNMDISDIMAKTTAVLDTANNALKNIEAATVNVKEITEKINSGQGTLGKLVNNNEIYKELHATTARVAGTAEEAKAGITGFKENMEALKHNWLFRGYFKKRGYTDESQLTQYQIDSLPNRKPEKSFVIDAGDLFSSNKTKLKHKKELNAIGRYLEDHPFGLAVISSYMDMAGDSSEDLKITQARALVVRQYLVRNFKLDDTRIKTKGLGKQQSKAGGLPEAIEVLVYP